MFVGILAFKLPIESLLLKLGLSEFESHHLAGIPSRVLIIVFSVFLIFKKNIQNVSGFSTPFKISNIQAVAFSLTIFLSVLYSKIDTFEDSGLSNIIIFLLSALLVGLTEEIAFRSLIFPLLAKQTNQIVLSMIVSSMIFGSVHYINLFKQPDNIAGISSQALLAFSIGMFFCGLLLRTRNIYVLGFLHFLFNISFGSGELKLLGESTVASTSSSFHWDFGSIVGTLTVFLLIAISGLVMKKLANDDEFLDEL